MNVTSFSSLCYLTFVLLFYDPVYGISGTFYADNGREQSVLFKTLAKRDKNELQEDFLNLLGLDHRPKREHFSKHRKNNGHRSSAEKYLLDLYKIFGDDDEDLENICRHNSSMGPIRDADYIISFENKIHDQFPHIRHESDSWFYFDVNKILRTEEVVKAELRIFRNITKKSQMNKKYKYAVYVYAVSENNYNSDILEFVDGLVITGADTEKWLVFNVTIPLMTWIAFPHKNLGLYLNIKSLMKYHAKAHNIKPYEIGLLTSRAPDEYKAFMVAYFKTPSFLRVRTKRAIKKRQHNTHYNRNGYNPYRSAPDRYIAKTGSCERWALYVSFKDLGFEDWIIAPDGYAAFYCDGSCIFPLNAHMNATNHAVVQTLLHLMDPTAVPKPCCAPTQLTAITVLYFDDNSNVILKRYKNMVVKSCGCH